VIVKFAKNKANKFKDVSFISNVQNLKSKMYIYVLITLLYIIKYNKCNFIIIFLFYRKLFIIVNQGKLLTII
jgi:hypothetical protein